MRFFLFLIIVLIQTLTLISAQDADEIDTSQVPLINVQLFKSSNLNLDFKYIDPEKGQVGIDYDLVLSTKSESDHSSGLNLKSRGFLTLSNVSRNSFSSIRNTLSYAIKPRFSNPQMNSTPEPRDTLTAITEGQSRSAGESRRSYLWLELHTNHETSQDLKDYNFTAGALIIADVTSSIGKFIDIPFQLLRTSNLHGLNKFELSASFDYVWGLNNTQLISDTTSISSINRASIGGFFETEIFNNIRLVCNVESYFLLDPPESIKQIGKNNNYFLQLRLDIPIDKKDDKSNKYISIKYIEGALPPNFITGYVLGAGFFMVLK